MPYSTDGPNHPSEAVRKLLSWRPEDLPKQFIKRHNPYSQYVTQKELDQDAKAPFFSESYLYNLLGKEDARTLLALLKKVLKEL